MRSKYTIRAAAAALLLLLIYYSIPSPASLAAAPTPTPTLQSRTSAPLGAFPLFLPLVQSKLSNATKGVPLTYNDCPSVTTMKASWEYAWNAVPPNCTGVENIPMIWGRSNVNDTLGGNSPWIMGFNEPDSGSQANISPTDAATLWRQIEQLYPSRKLLAPAPSGANPNWIVDFRNAYISAYGTTPRLDGLAVHCFAWYASNCVTASQQFITWASSWGVQEVWVTEFSFATTSPSSPSGALQEEQTFINWMLTQPKITHYAWFASLIQGNEWWVIPGGAFNNPLVDWNTRQPTSFGNVYLPYQ